MKHSACRNHTICNIISPRPPRPSQSGRTINGATAPHCTADISIDTMPLELWVFLRPRIQYPFGFICYYTKQISNNNIKLVHLQTLPRRDILHRYETGEIHEKIFINLYHNNNIGRLRGKFKHGQIRNIWRGPC